MKPSSIALILPALMFTSLAVSAVELPDMKPGQWQTTMQHSSGTANPAHGKGGTMSHCLDAKAQAAAKQAAVEFTKKNCSKNETRQDGNRWITDMVCKVSGKTMTTHSVTTFTGDEAYHTEMTTT